MRHAREERGIGPTRSRGNFFSPSAQENSLARQWVQSQEESQRNPVPQRFQAPEETRALLLPGAPAVGQRPDLALFCARVRLSRGALRVTSTWDVLPRRHGAGLGRTLKDPQPCSLCLGFLPPFSATPEVSFSRGLKDHMGRWMVSHISFLSHFCLSHVWSFLHLNVTLME